jgi:hypothetical protein
VADPCLNSSGFRYHIEYSRLMALRILREEAIAANAFGIPEAS